jgi:23S rRNA pseudouridine1911/1915/1917 synthase
MLLQPTILHHDEAIIVIEKPAGLLAIPDRYDQSRSSALTWLRARVGEVLVVHRIDRDTSGVMLFARTAEAHATLNSQFEGRSVEKEYDAVVDGTVAGEEGTIDAPIGPDARHEGQMRVDLTRGKPSVTDYNVLQRFRGFTRVRAMPHTGRQHQIRVHFASLGHPLTVDPLYGTRESFMLSSVKKNYRTSGDERPLIARLTLHAARLSFDHPITRVRATFDCAMPKDMRALITQLSKHR